MGEEMNAMDQNILSESFSHQQPNDYTTSARNNVNVEDKYFEMKKEIVIVSILKLFHHSCFYIQSIESLFFCTGSSKVERSEGQCL